MGLSTLAFLSFVVTLCLTPLHIRVFSSLGKIGLDRHKKDRPAVPEMGGIAIFLGILSSYAYIAFTDGSGLWTYVIASLSIVFIVGIVDDIFAIRQRTKLSLLLLSAIPLLFYSGGSIDLTLFVIGYGVLYAVLAIIGLAASSNLTNILEGFNGESIGLGVISTGFLLLDAQLLGNETMKWILLPVFASLLAFLVYNKYPARVFPGDTGTLLIGGAIGISVIVGGNVILGIVVLVPQIMEFILKSKVGFKGVSYGPTKVDEYGYLTPPPYSSVANFLTSRFRLKEYSLVLLLWSIGALFGFLSLIITIFIL